MAPPLKPPTEPSRGSPTGRWKRLWGSLIWDARFWTAVFLLGLTGIYLLKHLATLPHGPAYAAGEVVVGDIKAPRDFTFEDRKRTLSERRQARNAVLPVYDLDRRAASDSVQEWREALSSLRAETETYFANLYGPPPDGEAFRPPYPLPPPEPLRADSQDLLPDTDPALRDALYRHGFPEAAADWIASSLKSAQEDRISADVESLRQQNRILVRDIREESEWEDVQPERTLSLEEGRHAVRTRATEDPLEGWDVEEMDLLAEFAAGLVRPTLSPNLKESETRRARAESLVPPVTEVIPKGKIIVRDGEVVTPRQSEMLAALAQQSRSTLNLRSVMGYAALAAALLTFLFFYLDKAVPLESRKRQPLLGMLVLTTVVSVALGGVGLLLADILTESLQGTWRLTGDTLRYAVPWAVGAMVLSLLANRSVAVVHTLVYSVLMGLYLGGNFPVTLYCLLSGLGASFCLARFKKRSDPARACLFLGLVNVGAVLILHTFSPWLSGGRWSWWDYPAAFLGGAAVLVTFHLMAPLMEHAFGILTDMRLLELGDADNPLLRELSLRAPGTYQHSIAVGRLTEAAAEAIGANPLLCRVAALYHDIGKMRKPEYFIENQRDGVNPHDRLTPRMSTLIIVAHVKDGLMMTRKAGVPQAIRDLIPQHHGTRLISFFYKKAGEPGDDADFRYPGPKPQTREAAIFMLADGVEAAARTLRDPNPGRLKGMIRQVTNAVMLDGQLDECDLSFKEIDRIQDAFLKILLSMHHGRIDYPGFDFEKKKERRGDKVVRFSPGKDR